MAAKRAVYPSVPLDDTLLNRIISNAKDWALCHGFVTRSREHADKSDGCNHAPFMLLPSKVPKSIFEQANNVQKDMNFLYFLVSWDYDFIKQSLQEFTQSDDFTRRLLQIYTQIHEEGINQTIAIQIQRCDYVCHSTVKGVQLKQLKVNVMATEGGAMGDLCTKMHQDNFRVLGFVKKEVEPLVPKNNATATHAAAYGNRKAVVVFVVEDVNKNQLEQRHIEHRLIEISKQEVKVKRVAFTKCAERLALDKKTNILTLDNIEVAVVYFCAGNSPTHYKSDREWNMRLKIEKSKAIKCPWIGLQLAGTRKMQQVIAKPGVLERFFPDDKEKVEAIRSAFIQIWGLEQNGQSTTALVAEASAHPNNYILKNLSSGGSKSFYGQDIRRKAGQLSVAEQSTFILMERLQPMVNKNYFIRPFEPVQLGNCISELCVFGYLLGDGSNKTVLRTHAGIGGHIVRTKQEHLSDEGAAVSGFCIDSPFLV